MPKLSIGSGNTSIIDQIFIQDASNPSGAPLTGLNFQSAGLTWYYKRDVDAAPINIPLASGIIGTYIASGFVEVSPSKMPGIYEVGYPNAMFNGGNRVVSELFGAANMLANPSQIQVDYFNYQINPTTNSNLLQPINATGQTAETYGDCLNAARAQTFGNWILTNISGTGLQLGIYSAGGNLIKTFQMPADFTMPINPTRRY